MATLKLACVPEHFSLPIMRAKAALEGSLGRPVDILTFPGGTGAMCAALQAKEVDIAFALTEGALAFAHDNPEAVVVAGEYVHSPLEWGVHVGVQSRLTVECLSPSTCRFAISRFGSGSHLMAFVYAQNQGWDPKALRFHVVGNLAGAKEALPQQDDLVFCWEKAMTNPLVTQGLFRRIDVLPTPWPCFVVACRPQIPVGDLAMVLSVIQHHCAEFKSDRKRALESITSTFKLEPEPAQEWFDKVKFTCSLGVSEQVKLTVIQRLLEVGVIKNKSKAKL